METLVHSNTKEGRQKTTAEEKKQLLANLDLEVQHRARQFEETLAQVLENFKNHHEGLVLRVPKLVRNITMGEFADKYNGDINACLRGLQRERQGGEPMLDPITKKRKWKDTDNVSAPEETESPRAPKSARMGSPVKMDAAEIIKAHLNKTPKTVRTTRPPYPPLGPTCPSKPSSPKKMNRFMSPTKASASRASAAIVASSLRVPSSSSSFNPALPKTPTFPRAARKNDSRMLGNGARFAHERQRKQDLGGSDRIEDEDGLAHPFGIRRQQSIVIRKASGYSSSSESHIPRSRSPSRAAHSSTGSSASTSSFPSTTDGHVFSQPRGFMRVPTKDGHLLEFDPFMTTPAELDALEGITNSAKKQAREDMTRLVQAALERWKI